MKGDEQRGRAGSLAQLHRALVCWAISCSLHLWFHLLHSQFSFGGSKSSFVYSSLVVYWLGFGVYIAGVQVQSLTG